ncbi:hypothetical protein ACPPVT_07435 [Angustibacter sp. McL0619]|uniref:hypothetical protein n=1 Tax=Angustibacter sp. McL0619 TaxID=3415676 RepID=UPI003CF22788
MTQLLREDFGGASPGTAIGIGNSVFTANGATVPTFSATVLLAGLGQSMRCVYAAQFGYGQATLSSATTGFYRFYYQQDAPPSANMIFIGFRDTTGNNNRATVRANTTGALSIMNAATAVDTTNFNLTNATQYYCEHDVTGATQALRIYSGNAAFLLDTLTGAAPNAAWNAFRAGAQASITWSGYLDSIVLNDSATPGPENLIVPIGSSSTRLTTWDTLTTPAASTRSTTWTTAAIVAAATRLTSWATNALVSATRVSIWATLAAVAAATRATPWATRALATASRVTAWTVRATVGAATRTTDWETRQDATSSRITIWDVLQRLAAIERSTFWDTLRTVLPATRSTAWAVRFIAPRDVTLLIEVEPDRYAAVVEPDRYVAEVEPSRYSAIVEEAPVSTIEVSAGVHVYRWARVTEINGKPITADQIKVTLVPSLGPTPDVTGSGWYAPDDSEQVDDNIVRVALMVNGRFEPGSYRLKAVVADSSEVEIVVAAKNSYVTVK